MKLNIARYAMFSFHRFGTECSGFDDLSLLFSPAKRSKDIETHNSKPKETIKTYSFYTKFKHSKPAFKP